MFGTKSFNDLAQEIAKGIEDIDHSKISVIICPPFTILDRISETIKDSSLVTGSQDCHFENKGPFTGDVSAQMIIDAGAKFAIIGHSERRKHHFETDEMVAKKVLAAIGNDLNPIICVGESLEDRKNGNAAKVIEAQLSKSIPANYDKDEIIIAYEPIWAIGSGNVASAKDIAEMCLIISNKIKDLFGDISLKVLYGGSVNAKNAKDILKIDGVDGALVGGASLIGQDFIQIVKDAL